MRTLKIFTFATAAAAIVSAVGFLEAARAADTLFYLANSPGRSVDYLSLVEPQHDAIGYLESIRASSAAANGQTQTQTLLTRKGGSFQFGRYTAVRTADGYTLTGIARNGVHVERHFVRASLQAVNTSIRALQKSVVDNRTLAEHADYTMRLARAQANASAARTELDTAREAANRFDASARKAREDANARIEESGASRALNASRTDAMTRAASAEQDEAIAGHRLDLATTAAGAAEAELARLRRPAGFGRIRATAAFVTSDDAFAH